MDLMELRELIEFVVLVIILQAGVGLLIIAATGDAPGLDIYSIGVSILLLVVISAVIGIVLYWLVQRYSKERAIRTAMLAMSEDEKKVLRKIMNAGEARQDELRRELNFSKSKLSALVNNLVDKNAIEKVRYKRTNKLRPTKDFRR